jgi:cyclomaltodextrinase
VGGTPTIYYGDEFGWQAVKEERLGGDDAIRPTFPPPDADLDPRESATVDLHRQLVGVRRRHPWLHQASTTVPELANEQAVFVSRRDDDWLAVALNLSGAAVSLPVPAAAQVLAGDAELHDPGSDGAQVAVGPNGWVVVGPA